MSGVTRFSVSIERDLLQRFLRMAKKRSWLNWSEALRNVMSDALVREEWESDEEIVGTITIVYDHHKADLIERLIDIQHQHHAVILSTTHIHLDHDNCLEMIAVRGKAHRC